MSTDITVIQIRYSIDTTNEEYVNANNQLSEILPHFSALIIPIEKEILDKIGEYTVYYHAMDDSGNVSLISYSFKVEK